MCQTPNARQWLSVNARAWVLDSSDVILKPPDIQL